MNYEEILKKLMDDADVRKLMAYLKELDEETLNNQLELVQIPSPSLEEGERAKRFYELLAPLGLDSLSVDEAGNVIGVLKGSGKGPTLVLAAHMDTVFDRKTELKPRFENGRIYAPGIGDDTRGMVEVLAVAKAMTALGLRARGDIWFVGNVGEETMGDLKGSRTLFKNHGKEIGGFLSVDLGRIGQITATAVAGRKLRFIFRGNGGHALSNFGFPNANNALGRAIALIADIEVPQTPRTIFNVGIVKGGTSINAIPEEAEMLVDMRSIDGAILETLVEKVRAAVRKGLEQELARWNHPTETLTLTEELVSERPGGIQSREDPIVAAAVAADALFGAESVVGYASTDANIPISMGIPALALGRGGISYGAHTTEESYDPKDAYEGPQRLALLALALAGFGGVAEPILK